MNAINWSVHGWTSFLGLSEDNFKTGFRSRSSCRVMPVAFRRTFSDAWTEGR